MNKYIPFGILDQKMLDRIRLKQFRKDVENWVKIDHKDRYNFGVIESIKSLMQK